MVNIGLTRKDKEKLVIDLYKQGMTYAQIAKEAHVSLRDIGPILNMAGEHQSLSHSTQAYKMFAEGSTPLDVAIALNIREKEVREYYKDYWWLNGMYQLDQIYEELNDDIHSLIELHKRMKSEGLTPQQVTRILKATTTLEYNNRNLEYEQAWLNVSNMDAAQTFQQFTDLIQKDRKTREENEYFIGQQNRV